MEDMKIGTLWCKLFGHKLSWKKPLIIDNYHAMNNEDNNMEELIKKCKCSVSLEVNKYRDYYDTIDDAIKEIRERNQGDLDEMLEARMKNENCIYELQFYPNTPIGFNVVYGTSLKEVVEKALDCFKN